MLMEKSLSGFQTLCRYPKQEGQMKRYHKNTNQEREEKKMKKLMVLAVAVLMGLSMADNSFAAIKYVPG